MAKGIPVSKRRRELFIRLLKATGNVAHAAAEAGIGRCTAYALRAREAGFAARWKEAMEAGEEARARLRAAPPEEAGLDGLVIRRGRARRTQLVMAGERWWAPRHDARFLATLRISGNMAAAARAAGFSANAARARRLQWPAFDEACRRVLEDAEIQLEGDLIGYALNGLVLPEAGQEDAEPAPFDPFVALAVLRGLQRRKERPGYRGRAMPIEEVRDDVLRKIDALNRYKARFGHLPPQRRGC